MIARAIIPGSARVSRAGFGVSPKQSSPGSAGSLPAVFGSLPNTILVGKLPTSAGWQPALPKPERSHPN